MVITLIPKLSGCSGTLHRKLDSEPLTGKEYGQWWKKYTQLSYFSEGKDNFNRKWVKVTQ